MNMPATVLTTIATVGVTGAILLLLPRFARPTVPFGVRVPPSRVDAPVIRQATSQYYRGVTIVALVVIAAAAAAAVVIPPEVVLTVAPFILLAAWFVPYLAARRRVQEAKRKERWFEDVRQTAVADTSLRTEPPQYPWAWAAPSIVIAVATIAVGIAVYPSLPDQIATHFGTSGADRFADTTVWSAFGLPGIQVLITLLLLGLVPVVLRSKADLSAADPEGSASQYRRYATTMARLLLVLAAGMNLTFGVVSLMVWEVLPASGAWVGLSLVPTLVAAVVLMVVATRSGQSGHRLPVESTHDEGPAVADRDADDRWVAGMIYVNRDDPALWVPRRFGGIGWTMNFGRPAAWVLSLVLIGGSLGVTVWALVTAS